MSNEEIYFSVILPCYNRAAFIERTIHSVQNQQYQNWELIIVDDGSTDNTENIIQTITDSKIKYTRIANSERGAARNAGIRLAKGDFICFLDSDDYLLPNHLSEANKFISSNYDIKVFHQGFEIRKQDGTVLYSSKHLKGLLNRKLIQNNVISPNGIFLKKKIISNNLFREERLLAGTEDYELWLRIASQYPILQNRMVTSVLVDHPQRSMKETELEKLLNRIHFFLKCVEENADVKNWMAESYPEFIARRYSYIALHAALSNHRDTAFLYLKKALTTWLMIVFTKRFYVIVFRLFISKIN